MKRLALILLAALPLSAFTARNDDSCDIAVLPAATLLLPYFEVDLDDAYGETTIFTITNVTRHEQIAHVTLWNERAAAIADFDLFLTGYDVQGINLRDVLARALVERTGLETSPRGEFSSSDANPLADEETCRGLRNDVGSAERLRLAFTRGDLAAGYATIDVVRRCNAPHAQEPGFVEALSFENALTGDYQQLDFRSGAARGGPLVHIRAIPEDGRATAFERTFYSAYQSGTNRTRDARQPLPAAFAVPVAPGFDTTLKVWSESGTATELVAAGTVTGDWLQLDLGKQAWVIASREREHGMAIDVEATALANGCSQMTPPRTDDSCDIAVLPAATLLLPHFEVDLASRQGDSTEFTVTNTSALPQVAHVTLWTDYAFPVLSFDLILAGYDAQNVNLHDVIAFGRAPAGCGARPEVLPLEVRRRVQDAFTRGRMDDCANIGSTGHRNNNAIGYVTIDVVNVCTPLDATHPQYWDVIAFDNVLTGEYRQSDRGEELAGGAPLVHVRAIRGGQLEQTFYARFQSQSQRARDARQPLPSTFAARWIDMQVAMAETKLVIWQNGITGPDAACSAYVANVQKVPELVTFDEEENAAEMFWPCGPILCPTPELSFPATGSYVWSEEHHLFPPLDDAQAGWLYLNLGRQGWVTTTLEAYGLFSATADATPLGNGCSAIAPVSEVNRGPHVIGPRP